MMSKIVSDELWEIVEPLLHPAKPRRFLYPGRRPVEDRVTLSAILFVLKTGIPHLGFSSHLLLGSLRPPFYLGTLSVNHLPSDPQEAIFVFPSTGLNTVPQGQPN